MAKFHKPVAGSRAYWPKKRSKAMYDMFSSFTRQNPLEAFAAYKTGMTQVLFMDQRKNSPTHGKEVAVPVTVLASPPLVVAGIKILRKTPYGLKDVGTIWAEKIDKNLSRKTPFPEKRETKGKLEHFEKDKDVEIRLLVHTRPKDVLGKSRPDLFELPLFGPTAWALAKEKLGQEIRSTDVFKEGEFVDVKAVTTGKGYQGPVKRFGVKIRIRKATFKRRHIGSLGPRHPARVRANTVAEAGQLGFQVRTEHNKQILKIGSEGLTPKGGWLRVGELKGPFMLLSGSVPGPRKRLIMLRKGLRAPPEERIELKEIIKESQQ